MNKVEQWKAAKHGFDVWPDVLRYAAERTSMNTIDNADLERMKWHGVFYRKRDGEGTYMLRIRLTGCELSAAQAKEIAYIAYEYGYGIADVTTRANIQVQGLSIDHVPRAIARLEAVGLTAKQTGHDNVRNVFGHPLAGVDPEELIDTRELCAAITQLFVGSRAYSDLPRKFNIAVNGRPRHGTHYWTQDISLLACQTPGREVTFQVLIGGNQGQNPHLGRHLPVLVEPGQVVAVTRALLDLFREQGLREKRDESRFCYLLERIGVGGVLGYLEEHLDFPLRPSVAEPPPPDGYDELVGWLPQREPSSSPAAPQQPGCLTAHRWAMGLCIPLGRLAWQQLERLALLSRKWGDGALRTTHEQGIVVLNIPAGFRDAAATDAAACGLSLYADTLVRNAVACTGKQFCNIAVTETKGQMFQLLEKLRQRGLALHNIRIHMSGCPSACAAHHTADIGLKGVRVRRLLGTREGFDVYLGGGVAGQVHLARPFRLGVDADQLPKLVEDVIREYYLQHKPGQTFSAYWREQLTRSDAVTVGEGEYTPPVWLCEGCGYRHVAEDPPVFCPSCAGLRRLFARIENGADAAPSDEDAASHGASASPSASREDGFVYAAAEAQIPTEKGLAVQAAGMEIALFRSDGQIVAMENACPHQGAPLADGDLQGGVLTCPWHGWTFSPGTGCSLQPAGHQVRTLAVKVEGAEVYIRPSDLGENVLRHLPQGRRRGE